MSDDFKERMRSAINGCSKENGSNTPDFILTDYLLGCLDAFDRAVVGRECWYGRNDPFTGKPYPSRPVSP